jgi:hypothetical protein
MTFAITEAFTEAFDSELADRPDATWVTTGRATKEWPNGEDEAWWRANGPKMVERWQAWRETCGWELWTAPDSTLAVEIALEVTILGQRLKHFVDTVFATAPVNQRPIIVDVKSGAKPPDSDMQLGFYKVCVEAAYPGVKIAGGAYWSARTGELGKIYPLDQYTPGYVANLARQVSTARALRIFPPRVSGLCRSCKVGRFCAINRGSESPMDPDTHLMEAL